MSARKLGVTMNVLESIVSGSKKVFNDDGSLSYVYFEFDGVSYKMLPDGKLFKRTDYDDCFEEVKPNWCKSGIYPEYCFGSNIRIKLYVLALALTDDSFIDKYLSNSSLVVNHTVWSGKYVYVNRVCLASPLRETAYNPKYLEVITNSENVKHGRFVSKYNLFKVHVSYEDIDELEKFMLDPSDYDTSFQAEIIEHNIVAVEDYYKRKGISYQVRF